MASYNITDLNIEIAIMRCWDRGERLSRKACKLEDIPKWRFYAVRTELVKRGGRMPRRKYTIGSIEAAILACVARGERPSQMACGCGGMAGTRFYPIRQRMIESGRITLPKREPKRSRPVKAGREHADAGPPVEGQEERIQCHCKRVEREEQQMCEEQPDAPARGKPRCGDRVR